MSPTPDPLATMPVDMTALVYHTIDHDAGHHPGDVYPVSDPALAETLYAIGFAKPTAWMPPPDAPQP